MSPLDFDPRNDGYWGDTTATLDWCEQNYEVRKCHENVSFCSVVKIHPKICIAYSKGTIYILITGWAAIS